MAAITQVCGKLALSQLQQKPREMCEKRYDCIHFEGITKPVMVPLIHLGHNEII